MFLIHMIIVKKKKNSYTMQVIEFILRSYY